MNKIHITEIILCIMKKRIVLSALKIKELPFYTNSTHKRTKQQSKVYICKDCPACEKQLLCKKENTGKYMLKRESSCVMKSEKD